MLTATVDLSFWLAQNLEACCSEYEEVLLLGPYEQHLLLTELWWLIVLAHGLFCDEQPRHIAFPLALKGISRASQILDAVLLFHVTESPSHVNAVVLRRKLEVSDIAAKPLPDVAARLSF
jgi:hypothetical protein